MLDDIINKIKAYSSDEDVKIIQKAFDFGEKAHSGQVRVSGEPYLTHPLAVALILADLQLDISTIVAGILHDVIEDTPFTYEDIKNEFGQEIADLVDGVTKLSKIEYKTKEEQQAENMRKMLMAMAKDIRVILIKLADRLHNMRTLKYLPSDKQVEKAKETLEIYAPIAHRLGISKIQWELEDLSLRYIDPEGYYELVDKIAQKRKEREAFISSIIEILKAKLQSIGIEAEIDGRPKHFYSIYKKMKLQNKTFEQIFDLTAIRVIVNTVKDCYGVLGIVHTLWKPIPGRFKDYIAMPKPNMYQSLHTTVIGLKGQVFEVQIRTWEMHRTAEYGIAAHWKYKEGKSSEDDFDEKLTWLRQLLEWQRELKDPREFMEALKIDLFTDEVFVFTPKGDVINLPYGSTPIDFAYMIHTDIGHRCIGAKVNGKIVPLDTVLKTGDIVEIMVSPNKNHGPSRDWLKIVKSSQAKNKINQWFKKEQREENIEKGKDLIEKEIKRQGLSQYAIKDEIYDAVLRKLNFKTTDEMYVAVGVGSITPVQVVLKIKEELKIDGQQIITEQNIENIEVKKKFSEKKNQTGVKVKGIDNIMVKFAKCCSPIPGDEIIGYITRGRGVTIHRKDCVNITNSSLDNNRLVEVEWAINVDNRFPADIQIISRNRYGLLTDVTNILSEAKTSVKALNARASKDDLASISLTVEVNTKEDLNKLINRIKLLTGIIDVYRINTA
ncbi:GTP pyrophosphokinase [Caldanaerobius fijiensis DSM 17918]|uniref:GTP diphosphokinase n=1 Tax=Caldanaerobius fijiensis DSM 17918 TaxID=1121256 RepID=A0A1M4TZ81_9THEO|nr:bifunctional (p)ppGpp synthetase/guanosine-3',5'-bis(diphosphate) 3'-pyrophosphohydrolase [Caldanaerobius fijiensis]SHE49654.1 GTP pyrophosphokinase [Caldanaerobius fijiensis DSM 17918]